MSGSDQERKNGQYALVIGAWAGNSDNSPVSTPGRTPLASLDVTAPLWSAIMTDVTSGVDRRPKTARQPAWGIDNFQKPNNLVQEGWKRTTLKPGDHVTIFVHPLRNGDKGGSFAAVKLADGTTLGQSASGKKS